MGTALLAVALAASPGPAGAATAPGGRRCDRAVSYFLAPEAGAAGARFEWRLFDPADRSDRVFLALPDRIDGVRWDPKFRNVTFASDGWIYRAPWAWATQPSRVGRLHGIPDLADWWFNPDSGRWQAAAMREVGERLVGQDMLQLWWVGLWQSSADGMQWHLAMSDTLVCDEDACTWPWYREPRARQETTVPMAALGYDVAATGWVARSRLLDTTRVALPSAAADRPWRLMPLREPRRLGVAFRALANAESLVSRPYYLVDLERRTARLLPEASAPRESWVRTLLDERCGLLLLPGEAGEPLVLDAATGAVVFSRPQRTERAAWLPRPRGRPAP